MACRNQTALNSHRVSPREAVNFSCYFLNVLTGRKPMTGAQRLATRQGWEAFAKIRRRIPARYHQVRVRRMTCPSERTAEIVAMVEDGGAHQAMTFTFLLTGEGWRLDDCDLLQSNRRVRR